MDQRCIAAFHEAGHVVIRKVHGLATSPFVINADGTGRAAPSGGRIADLNVDLDITMGGPVAEDLLLERPQCPDANEIEEAIYSIAEGDIDPDWYLDLDDAIEILQRRVANPTNAEIVAAIQASYNRCLVELRNRWTKVERLAACAIESSDGIVNFDEIETIRES